MLGEVTSGIRPILKFFAPPTFVRHTRLIHLVSIPRNSPILSFKNFSSAGLPPAPAVCPHSEGIGTSETFGMNAKLSARVTNREVEIGFRGHIEERNFDRSVVRVPCRR